VATDRLGEIDLQSNLPPEELSFAIDDIENILQEREDIKERAEAAQMAMMHAISAQQEDDLNLIRFSFEGEEIQYSLTGDRRLAKETIYKLLEMQKAIIKKDSVILKRFSAKQEEVRSELKNLQSDKKKIDFLNLTATGAQDSSGFNV
jgi:hypothetical protein